MGDQSQDLETRLRKAESNRKAGVVLGFFFGAMFGFQVAVLVLRWVT
jgi:hypothetical protein